MPRLTRFFVATPYAHEEGEPVPFLDIVEMLHDGAYRSCRGFFGDAQLETGWHALWGFETRRKAKRFLSEGYRLVTMKEVNLLMREGRYTRRAHYLTDEDPPEQML